MYTSFSTSINRIKICHVYYLFLTLIYAEIDSVSTVKYLVLPPYPTSKSETNRILVLEVYVRNLRPSSVSEREIRPQNAVSEKMCRGQAHGVRS